MSQTTAKRSGMSEEKLKDALASIIEDLNTAEEKLGIKLGPQRFCSATPRELYQQLLVVFLAEAGC